jgi:uncharacterized membrane protein YraQ (UPF0718 family)
LDIIDQDIDSPIIVDERDIMDKTRRVSRMLIPTVIMGILAVVLLLIGYLRGGEHIIGLKSALSMTIEILPLLIFAFIVAGMVQVLLPRELLSTWVGLESGMRGIFIGTIAGASVGTMVAFLTGWSLWAVSRLPMDVGILGWRFTLIRVACTFFFPPIAGYLAQVFFESSK